MCIRVTLFGRRRACSYCARTDLQQLGADAQGRYCDSIFAALITAPQR
jgi:hypothetical protein